jgi:hypothetical protein
LTKAKPPKSGPKPNQRLTFPSTLERIAEGMEYYALPIPAEISEALGARAAVPVTAKVNGSDAFIASLYPVGGGRHYLRVRNKVCKSVGITAGDRVQVEIVVRDRSAETAVPADLKRALQDEDLLDGFHALPVGKRSFLLRVIDQAAKPETRLKRIGDAVEEARARRDKLRG